jgi:hypothetical protein
MPSIVNAIVNLKDTAQFYKVIDAIASFIKMSDRPTSTPSIAKAIPVISSHLQGAATCQFATQNIRYLSYKTKLTFFN